MSDTTILAYIPSPPQGVWHLGPLPIRAYALCIIIGIIVAVWWGDKRWRERGGQPGDVLDVALFAVPFGLIGGRIYHVITDWDKYFGAGGAGFGQAVAIWDGGLGIWGAVLFGAFGAWLGCRWKGIKLPPFADALAPAIIVAQAIGRLGNYFNQELFGKDTSLPWGLEIYQRVQSDGTVGCYTINTPGCDLMNGSSNGNVLAVVQPTFLYELLWNLLVAALLVLLDRRFTIGHGRLFALYVALYSVGRFGIEMLRSDPATYFHGVRINVFVAAFCVLCGALYFLMAPRGRETGLQVYQPARAEELGEVGYVPPAVEGEAPAAAVAAGAATTATLPAQEKPKKLSRKERKAAEAAAKEREAEAQAGTRKGKGGWLDDDDDYQAPDWHADERNDGAAGAVEGAVAKAETAAKDAVADVKHKVEDHESAEAPTAPAAPAAPAEPGRPAEEFTRVESWDGMKADEPQTPAAPVAEPEPAAPAPEAVAPEPEPEPVAPEPETEAPEPEAPATPATVERAPSSDIGGIEIRESPSDASDVAMVIIESDAAKPSTPAPAAEPEAAEPATAAPETAEPEVEPEATAPEPAPAADAPASDESTVDKAADVVKNAAGKAEEAAESAVKKVKDAVKGAADKAEDTVGDSDSGSKDS